MLQGLSPQLNTNQDCNNVVKTTKSFSFQVKVNGKLNLIASRRLIASRKFIASQRFIASERLIAGRSLKLSGILIDGRTAHPPKNADDMLI